MQQSRLKCIAGDGRLELRGDRDFTEIERRKLEAGLMRFLDAID